MMGVEVVAALGRALGCALVVGLVAVLLHGPWLFAGGCAAGASLVLTGFEKRNPWV